MHLMHVLTTHRVLASAALIVGALAGAARAAPDRTGYTVATASNLYETPPAWADPVEPINLTQKVGNMVDLPFEFPFFGRRHDRVFITIHGVIEFRETVGLFLSNNVDLAQVVTSEYVPDTGICVPYWCQGYFDDGTSMVTWTAGESPNRRFYVTWVHNGNSNNFPNHDVTYQVKLLEATGEIVFAYAPDSIPSTWNYSSYTHGLAAPDADGRYIGAANDTQWNVGRPDDDYIFTPKTIEITGTVLYDRDVADGDGVGSTFEEDLPLAGVRVQLHDEDGVVSAATTTDEFGGFRLEAYSQSSDLHPTLRAAAAGRAAEVRADVSAGAPHDYVVKTDMGIGDDLDVGTLRIEHTAPASGMFRAAVHAAVLMQRAWDYIEQHTGKQLPTLDVRLGAADSRRGRYNPPRAGGKEYLHIAGPAADNDDAWDEAIIMRGFGRHAAGALGVHLADPADETIDGITDAENAFSAAFGYYLYAVVTGESEAFDTNGAAAVTTFDLEDPTLSTRKGPDVAGWVIAALYDLVDGANEPHDWAAADGAPRLVEAVALVDTVPTMARIDAAWDELGAEGLDFSRLCIHHGLLADDALEANDEAAEATDLGAAGVIRKGLVLNRRNEDWFEFDLPIDTPRLGAEVAFSRVAMRAGVEIEIYRDSGASIALTTDMDGTGPIRARSGPVSAGTYRVRVTHLGGERVSDYTMQAFPALLLADEPLGDWTVGQPFERVLPLVGGVLPYSLSDLPVGGRPPGLYLAMDGTAVRGTPTTPGRYSFSLLVADAGVPQHVAARSYEMVISEALDLALAEYVAFPAGRDFDVTYAHVGGTPPLAFSISDGVLPDGASMDPGALRFHGRVATPGMARITIDGVDLAGSRDQARVGAVACAALETKRGPAPLAAGPAATGYFVDAVAGSRIDVSVRTAKKRAKRRLRAIVLGPDGRERSAAKFKGGKGKASVKKLIADMTGRYYVVLAAEDGEATELLGGKKVKPGKKGKGVAPVVEIGESFTIEIGALAGAGLTLKLKPAKKSGLVLRVQSLIAPSGAPLPLAGLVTEKGPSLTLRATLAESGTWKVTVRAASGGAADVAWAYRVKQPKGVVYAED